LRLSYKNESIDREARDVNRLQSYEIGIAGESGAEKIALLNRILANTGPGAVVVVQYDGNINTIYIC